MASIFSKIIAGEIPCYKVGETESCFAFLDIRPQQRGHTLVVPKREVDKLFDLDAESYAELFTFAKKIALSIEKEFDCNRCGMAVIGLEVPHAHIHLIPINSLSDMTFSIGMSLEPGEFQQIAELIGGNI